MCFYSSFIVVLLVKCFFLKSYYHQQTVKIFISWTFLAELVQGSVSGFWWGYWWTFKKNILGQLLAQRRTSKGYISCQHLFAELIPLFRVQTHLMSLLHSSKCLHVDNFNPSKPQSFSETFLRAPAAMKVHSREPWCDGLSKSSSDLFFLSRAALTRPGWAWPGGLLSALHLWRSSLLTCLCPAVPLFTPTSTIPLISKWSQSRGSRWARIVC